MSRERTGDGIHQDAKGRLTTLTAGVPKRQDALDPVMAFFTGSPMGSLAPQDTKAQGPLCQGHSVLECNADKRQRLSWLGRQPAACRRNVGMARPPQQPNHRVA